MLLFVLLVLVVLVLVEVMSKKERVTIHVEPVTKDTIFVVLPLYRPTDPIGTLLSIFQNADAPQCIRVGVLEHNHAAALAAVDLYYAEQQKDRLPPFAHQIKHKKSDTAYYGAAAAREWIVDHQYGGERYLLFLTQSTRLLPHWDRILIGSLAIAHSQGGHIVSQFPCTSQHDCTIPSTFPVLQTFNSNHTPVFKGRLVTGDYRQPLKTAMVSWRCLFGSAVVLRQQLALHSNGLPFLPSAEADLLASYEIWTQGYQAFTPADSAAVMMLDGAQHSWADTQLAPVVQFTETTIRSLLAGKQPADSLYFKKLAKRQQHQLKDFLRWLRIKPAQQQASGLTRLGLLPGHTELEIVRKYGSVQRFQAVKEKFI